MKIAILSPVFWTFDGISRVVEDQAREFSRQGNHVSIFTLAANMEPPPNVSLYLLDMPRGSLGQRIYRLLFPLDFVKAIKWVPKLKSYDIIYSHQYPITWLAYLAKKFYKIKYTYYNHGIYPPWTSSYFVERVYIRMFALLANWIIKKADSAISVSRYLQQQLKKETGLDSEVIYNKVDNQRFHKGVNGSKIREKLQLGSEPIILYVGRISPHKGIHLLIEAFDLVKQEIPEAKLLIAGKHTFDSYSRKLKQMSDDSVIFAGYVSDEDLPYYYAACDVYATCTLWEGFNLPLVEAQTCGKPVVAFSLGPHPEVIDDGETGILVEPHHIGEFASGIINALQNKDGMGKRAAKWAERFAPKGEADITRIVKDAKS